MKYLARCLILPLATLALPRMFPSALGLLLLFTSHCILVAQLIVARRNENRHSLLMAILFALAVPRRRAPSQLSSPPRLFERRPLSRRRRRLSAASR